MQTAFLFGVCGGGGGGAGNILFLGPGGSLEILLSLKTLKILLKKTVFFSFPQNLD